MDQAGQNSANNPEWLKNFGMPKNTRQNDALDRAIYAAKNQAANTESSSPSTTNNTSSPNSAQTSSDQPRSAQEIINARYQSQPATQPSAPRPTLSARDAINTAHSQKTASRPGLDRGSADSDSVANSVTAGGSVVTNLALTPEPAKPASRLHRGFIQKSLESTRPSASAILGTNSPDGEVPVVSTSLKLGANALPKKPTATLPPGARMARAAKSVDSPAGDIQALTNRTTSKKLLNKIGRAKSSNSHTDAQIILPEIVSDDPTPRSRRRSSAANRSTNERSALSAGLVAGNIQVALDDTPKPAKRRPRQPSGKVSQIPVIQSGERKIEVHSDHEELATTSSPARRARQPLGISDQIALGAGAASRQLQTDPQMISPERPRGPQGASLARPQTSSRRSLAPRFVQKPTQPSVQESAQNHIQISTQNSIPNSTYNSVQSSRLASGTQSQPQSINNRDANAKLGAAALQALLDGSIEPEALGLRRSDLQAIAAAKDNQALKAALAGKTVGDLGVIEDYAPAEGRAKGRETEAVGSVGLSARDPKNPKAHKAEDSRRTLGKQSPFFLKSVNVEKRPLSHDNAGIPASPRSVTSSAPVSPEKPVKLGTVRTVSRRSTFSKAPKPPKEKHRKKDKQQEKEGNLALPDRPTVIVPASHRSNAPLFFLLILTILLGAAVGAAAYLCFFQ